MQVHCKLHLGRFILHRDAQNLELLYNTVEKWSNQSRPESCVQNNCFSFTALVRLWLSLLGHL